MMIAQPDANDIACPAPGFARTHQGVVGIAMARVEADLQLLMSGRGVSVPGLLDTKACDILRATKADITHPPPPLTQRHHDVQEVHPDEPLRVREFRGDGLVGQAMHERSFRFFLL